MDHPRGRRLVSDSFSIISTSTHSSSSAAIAAVERMEGTTPAPLKLASQASMPLFPLSPERVNASANARPPQSPSLPAFEFPGGSPFKKQVHHARDSSDVQGMVARFNSLDIKDHAELRKKDEAALRRAQMGREEAEGELKRVREERRALKREYDEGVERERKVVKRLDVVMEELHRAKETHHHAQTLYEKEIRRARKEAFKSSSAVVKLQEELKASRNALRVTQSDLEMQEQKAGRRDEEVFTAQYELAGSQEKMSQLEVRIKIVEEERDALKMSMKHEDVTRIASEGKVALPPATQEDDLDLASPRKKTPAKPMNATRGHEMSRAMADLEQLRDELILQTRSRQVAEDQVEFMKMECQFGCCSCRVAEYKGSAFIHDGSLKQDIIHIRPSSADEAPPAYAVMELDAETQSTTDPAGESKDANMHDTVVEEEPTRSFTPDVAPQADENGQNDPIISQTPPSNTSYSAQNHHSETLSISTTPSAITISHDSYLQQDHLESQPATPSPTKTGLQQSSPQIPTEEQPTRSVRTITTTTTIPLHFPPSQPASPSSTSRDFSTAVPASDFFSPNGMTREEAIEQLRQRRGRARSVAANANGVVGAGSTPKRAVSHHHQQQQQGGQQGGKGKEGTGLGRSASAGEVSRAARKAGHGDACATPKSVRRL